MPDSAGIKASKATSPAEGQRDEAGESSGRAAYEDLKEKNRREKRIKKLEELMQAGDKEIEELSESLQDPAISADYEKLSGLQSRIDEIKEKQEEYTEEWMSLSE